MVYEYIADLYMWIYDKCKREKKYSIEEVMEILNKNFIKYSLED